MVTEKAAKDLLEQALSAVTASLAISGPEIIIRGPKEMPKYKYDNLKKAYEMYDQQKFRSFSLSV